MFKLSPLTSSISIVAAAVLLGGMTSCSTSEQPAGGDLGQTPKVVTTSSIIGDLVSMIAGDTVDVSVLIPAGSDPHEYQPSTREVAALRDASAVFSVGFGFEEALEPQLRNAESDGVTIVALAEHADPLEAAVLYGDTDGGGAGGGDADHAEEPNQEHSDEEEHSHSPVDPHFWHDPQRVIFATYAIEESLIGIEGVDATVIASQADSYRAELNELDAELELIFEKIPEANRKLVTQHRVLGYLAHRYGFETLGSLIPATSTLAQASAAELDRVASSVASQGVNAIFIDVTQSDALAQIVASEAGGDVQIIPIYTESLSREDGAASTYSDLMRSNADDIVTGLTQ